MTIATLPRHSLRLRGRTFLALVLVAETPTKDWLAELDEWLRRSPGFFLGRPVVLDLGGTELGKEEIAALMVELRNRDIRPMGIEGTKQSYLGDGMPPLVSGGKQVDSELPDLMPKAAEPEPETKAKDKSPAEVAKEVEARRPERARSLLVDTSVRSGQSVIYPQGDVTIVGSVGWGAEVIAGGSIHVYGALRGRAIAGSTGSAHARIFCGRLEAELLAIDGLYWTAEDMPAQFRGRQAQVWLEHDELKMGALN